MTRHDVLARCRKSAPFVALLLATLHLPLLVSDAAHGEEAAPPPPVPSGWAPVASMGTARWGPAAAAGPHGRIYVFGGETNGGITLSSAEVFNPNSGKWKTIAPMPTARNTAAAATGPDGRIYVMGGFRPALAGCTPPGFDPFFDCQTLNTVEAYDPLTDSWATMAPMPTQRRGLAAATGPDGRIYAIGGVTAGSQTPGNVVEAFTPPTPADPDGSWATVAPMSIQRHFLGAATGADGRIYAIGGRVSEAGPALNTVEAFDTATGSWAPVAPMKTARFRLAAAAGPDGRIYALGGRDDLGNDLAEVQALRPGPTATWEDVAPMGTPRQQPAAAGGADRVYAIGGSSGPNHLSSVEAFRP